MGYRSEPRYLKECFLCLIGIQNRSDGDGRRIGVLAPANRVTGGAIGIQGQEGIL